MAIVAAASACPISGLRGVRLVARVILKRFITQDTRHTRRFSSASVDAFEA
jgi:hypothetical protein